MFKKTLIPILLLLVTSCGFNPLYSNLEKVDYNINFVEKRGDNLINNKIISEISRLTNNKSNNIFNIISKDAKGSATNYELSVNAKISIEYKDNIKEINISESQNIKKISDIFEQKNYENTLKNNFAISIVNKLNIELLSIKWS